MTTDDNIPETQNEGYGFYGTMRGRASEAWPLAFVAIRRLVQLPGADVRAFLDSAGGRHFAHEVQDHLDRGCTMSDAIDAVAQRWNRKIVAGRFLDELGVIVGRSLLLVKVIEAGDFESQFPSEH